MSAIDSRVINEAAQWMALVQSGHASPEEFQAFAAWRESDPRHAEVCARMGAVWAVCRWMRCGRFRVRA